MRFGIEKYSNEIIDVYDLGLNVRGLNCNCKCPECGSDLVAVRGEIYEHHFRHYNEDIECGGNDESLIHSLAKKIIIEHNKLILPIIGEIEYINAIKEKSIDIFRTDVEFEMNGEKVYVEIFVTHSVDESKELYFKQNKIKSFEIDLRFYKFTNKEQFIKDILFCENNKRIIHWFDQEIEKIFDNTHQKTKNKLPESYVLYFVIFTLGLYFIYRFFVNKKQGIKVVSR